MNKRGFTLIELLGVLIIIAVLAVITTPIIEKVLDDQKEKTYQRQVDTILNSARQWAVEHNLEMPKKDGSYYKLSLKTLKASSYYDEGTVINPIDDSIMDGCIYITFKKANNKLVYEYKDNTCTDGLVE